MDIQCRGGNGQGLVNFQEMKPIDVNPIHAGHYGGNLISLPDGNCVIGLSRFENELEAKKFAEKICGSDANILVLDTTWLSVSHVDEILSYLKSNGDICQAPFRIPSTSLAKKILREELSKNLYSLTLLQEIS